jgi:carboxyl-terminal processing protease
MKGLTALVAVWLVSTACLAETPVQRFEQQSAQASSLAQQKSYREAAAVLEKMAADPSLTAQTNWPDRLYDLACAYAMAGAPDKALTTLEDAVAMGAMVEAGDVEKQPDLASLRDNARFKLVVDRLKKRMLLWQDNPAIATAYKPVLSEEEKVAGLSKIWSEARFNFPFFDRISELDWDGAYMAALPQVRATQTTEDYYRVLSRFTALLMDGHTRVLPPTELMDRFNGVTAVDTRLVEGKIMVTGVSDPTLKALGIRTGAEVVSIDGKPALDYAKTEPTPYVFGFTPQDRAVWQYGFQLLRGPVGQPVQLSVKDAHGKTFSAAVPRVHNEGAFGILPKLDRTASFKMLPGNIAYLEINWFIDDAGLKALKENFAVASAADGLIIDIRQNGGGNDDNSHDLVKALADKPFQGSNWRTVDYKASYRSWNRPTGWLRSPAPTFQPNPDLHYGKPVVVLISGRTYSAAEDFLVSFISSGRGKLVGETSGGSTGNPMLLRLPGGGMAFICTKDDSFADGRVFEGVGIAPDVTVKPTIADIRAGRDPVIEKAVAMLKKTH